MNQDILQNGHGHYMCSWCFGILVCMYWCAWSVLAFYCCHPGAGSRILASTSWMCPEDFQEGILIIWTKPPQLDHRRGSECRSTGKSKALHSGSAPSSPQWWSFIADTAAIRLPISCSILPSLTCQFSQHNNLQLPVTVSSACSRILSLVIRCFLQKCILGVEVNSYFTVLHVQRLETLSIPSKEPDIF